MEDEAALSITSWKFRNLDPITDTAYEVQLAKGTIRYYLSELVRFYVYQYAKMVMLDFYFNFLQKYLMWNPFEMLKMETDSAYFAFAHDNLNEGIKPGIDLRDWLLAKQKYLVLHPKDKRVPGLFKEEWVGDGIICFSSKTYYDWGSSIKCSTKASAVAQINLTKTIFFTS